MHKVLGKISKARFGFGGYQDAQFGYWIIFSMPGSGCATGEGVWASKPTGGTDHVKKRQKFMAEIYEEIIRLVTAAKVKSFDELVGIPVELTFESEFGKLQSWRILEEVL